MHPFSSSSVARLFLVLTLPAFCAVSPFVRGADKSGYSLANPTPATLLREMSTDRPDATESPFTVDAGHAQVEMDFATLMKNHLAGVHTTQADFATTNLRLGLLPNMEAGVFVSPYTVVNETLRDGTKETRRGFGDVTLRGKLNLLGNDGGDFAFGFIVDLKLPTARQGLGNGVVEGALIAPVNVELPHGWEFGAMTELDIVRSDETGRRDVQWTNTATLGHALTSTVSGYFEITSSTGSGPHLMTADVGLTLKVDPNMQLDAGVNLGITTTADDTVFFAGLSRRF